MLKNVSWILKMAGGTNGHVLARRWLRHETLAEASIGIARGMIACNVPELIEPSPVFDRRDEMLAPHWYVNLLFRQDAEHGSLDPFL